MRPANRRRAYFHSHRSGSGEAWKRPAEGGDAVQITHNTGDLPEESRDGKFLRYMKGEHYPEQCSIRRMPTGGGQETRVETAPPIRTFAAILSGLIWGDLPSGAMCPRSSWDSWFPYGVARSRF
jgi:hypothetical protein